MEMTLEQEQFWSTYYVGVAKTRHPWLDYSNDRVQAQTFGLALEAAGPVRDRKCVDIGCGWGHFALALDALGASAVTGIDIVPDIIAHNEQHHPKLRWLIGSLNRPELEEQLQECDIAFMLEVLQYVPFGEAIRRVWSRVLPGGRMVAIVPNASCPIVQQTRSRFGGSYAPPTADEVLSEVSALPDLASFGCRGLVFAQDQAVAPYAVTPWTTSPVFEAVPNRLQFVAIKHQAESPAASR